MFIVEVNIRLHALCYTCHNESFNGRLFLSSESLFFTIMSLPLQGEEVYETAQSLAFSLDLSLPLAESAQPIDICGHPHVSYRFYGPSHHVVHLKVLA